MENIKSDMRKLLVVGGTGFIGMNLVKKAILQGFNVTVISLNKPADDKSISGAEYISADITDIELLQEKLKGNIFEYVINLSGYIDHSNLSAGGRKVIDTHFIGLLNLLEVLDLDKLKRFVQIGSSDEYGNLPAPQSEELREAPISPYSLSKVASTQLLQMLYKTEGLPAVIFRLFLVYGPGQDNNRFLPQLIQGCLADASFPTSEGRQLRDFCFVDDVTNGIMMALCNDQVNGELINLASGKPVAIRDIVEQVRSTIGKGTPNFGEIPYRSGENMELYANISKANKILGWRPSVTVKEGIIKTADYYQREIM